MGLRELLFPRTKSESECLFFADPAIRSIVAAVFDGGGLEDFRDDPDPCLNGEFASVKSWLVLERDKRRLSAELESCAHLRRHPADIEADFVRFKDDLMQRTKKQVIEALLAAPIDELGFSFHPEHTAERVGVALLAEPELAAGQRRLASSRQSDRSTTVLAQIGILALLSSDDVRAAVSARVPSDTLTAAEREAKSVELKSATADVERRLQELAAIPTRYTKGGRDRWSGHCFALLHFVPRATTWCDSAGRLVTDPDEIAKLKALGLQPAQLQGSLFIPAPVGTVSAAAAS